MIHTFPSEEESEKKNDRFFFIRLGRIRENLTDWIGDHSYVCGAGAAEASAGVNQDLRDFFTESNGRE